MNSRIEDLINRCYSENDKKTIVNLLRLQSEINGLKKDKLDITTNGENINTTIINIINPNGDKL